MEMQAEAERRKRATVLESEAEREAQVNRAEGAKRRVILEASAEAESISVRAKATAESLGVVGSELATDAGREAARMRVAELYLKEFGRIAKAGNTVLLPADAGNPAAMVAQALAAIGATADALPGGIGGGSGGARRIVAGDESFIRTVTGGAAGAPGAAAGGRARRTTRELAAENLAPPRGARSRGGGVLRGRGEKRTVARTILSFGGGGGGDGRVRLSTDAALERPGSEGRVASLVRAVPAAVG